MGAEPRSLPAILERLFDRPEAQFVVFEPAVGIERSQACKKASQTGFEDLWGPMCWHP